MSRPIRRSADLAQVSLRHFIMVPAGVILAVLAALLLPAQPPGGTAAQAAPAADAPVQPPADTTPVGA